jgi:hypothetical protein
MIAICETTLKNLEVISIKLSQFKTEVQRCYTGTE